MKSFLNQAVALCAAIILSSFFVPLSAQNEAISGGSNEAKCERITDLEIKISELETQLWEMEFEADLPGYLPGEDSEEQWRRDFDEQLGTVQAEWDKGMKWLGEVNEEYAGIVTGDAKECKPFRKHHKKAGKFLEQLTREIQLGRALLDQVRKESPEKQRMQTLFSALERLQKANDLLLKLSKEVGGMDVDCENCFPPADWSE